MTQLEAVLEACRAFQADLRYHPEDRYFTVTVWDGWDTPAADQRAEKIQARIRELAAQYPDVVCYCFDRSSTLVYVV